MSLALARGRTIVVADTAVHDMPTADELADIAEEAAGVAHRLGLEPRVALLAYSTFGHPTGERSERVREAVQGVSNREPDRLARVLGGDEPINDLHIEVDDRCFKLLALHQPMAADLRIIVAAVKINTDLERVGDLAVNIAEAGVERWVKLERADALAVGLDPGACDGVLHCHRKPHERVRVEPVGPGAFRGIELAFFSAGSAQSKEYAPQAVKAGAVVVDKSSAFRMDPTVPLVVPEINSHALRGHRGIVACPNCTTIVTVMPLRPLHDAGRLRRVIATSRFTGQPITPASRALPESNMFGFRGQTAKTGRARPGAKEPSSTRPCWSAVRGGCLAHGSALASGLPARPRVLAPLVGGAPPAGRGSRGRGLVRGAPPRGRDLLQAGSPRSAGRCCLGRR